MVIKEIEKIIKNKLWILFFIIAGLFIAILVFILENKDARENMCEIKTYKSIYKEIENMNVDYAYDKLQKKYDICINDDGLTIDSFGYKVVISEVKQCLNYQEYLDNIQKKADKNNLLSILGAKDSYSQKSDEKTAKAFQKLDGRELKIGPSKGINMITSNMAVDLIALMLIFTVASFLFIKERENGMYSLIRCCRGGRANLAVAKLATIAVSCLCIEFFIYLPLTLISYFSYGFGDLGRSIQSVYGFLTTDLKISVGQFLILFFILKYVTYIMFGMIISLVINIFNSNVIIYVTIIAVGAISFAFYKNIGNFSKYVILKNINFAAFLNTNGLLSTYTNIRIFGNPVNYRTIYYIFLAVFTIVGFVGSVITFSKKYHTSDRSKLLMKFSSIIQYINPWNKIFKGGTVLNELYKIFVKCKVALIVFVFGIIMLKINTAPKNIYDDVKDVYYKMAVNEVQGEYSEEKVRLIETRIKELTTNNSDDDISVTYKIEAYKNLLKKSERFKKINNGVFIYDKGFGKLTGTNPTMELALGMETVFILIVSLAAVFAIEYQNGMDRLLNTTPNGRIPVNVTKTVTSLIVSIGIYLGVHIPWYVGTLKLFGTEYINSPAKIMNHLQILPECISIKEFIIYESIIKIGYLFICVLFMRFISKKIRSTVMSMTITTGIFVLPLAVFWIMKGV